MAFLEILIIAVSLSMDAFGVAVSNCMLLPNLPLRKALKFGIFFGFFQFIMPVIGYTGGITLSQYIMRVSNWISLILLAIIGGKMIYESFHTETCCDIAAAQAITSARNLTTLAVATSIDALAVGVTFALDGTKILFAAATIGIVAFFISTGGALAGSYLSHTSPKYAQRIGGVILIGVGVKIFFGF